MNDRDIVIGNLTTIIMFVFATFGGGAIVNWLGGTSQASVLIGAVLGLGYSVINAYFPNHMKWLKNNKDIGTIVDNLPKIDDEYVEDDFAGSEDDGGC